MTPAELLALCRRELSGLRGEQVEILVSAAAGIPRSRLFLEKDRDVGDPSGLLRSWIARLARGEPLQYVLGAWDFFGREFLLSRDTLIPRPETEELVEAVLSFLRREGPAAPLVLDVGTGCGAIAVTLAAEILPLRAVAVDICPAALRVALANARRTGVADRVLFAAADGYCALKSGCRFDVVVSNPPYVSEGEWLCLPPAVRDFEPRGALVAGPDGLFVLRRLVEGAAAFLRPGGSLWCEIGASQGRAVAKLPAPGLRFDGVTKDLAGRDRVARWTRV